MYGASERFNEIILGDSRQFKARIKVGEKEISTGFRSVRQYAQSSDTGYVSIGGAVSSYIEVEMWKPEVMLENAEIEVSIGLLVDGEPEYVPLGLYTVLKPQNDDGVIRFTAYDRIQSKMSGAYFSELSYPADGKDLLKEISTKTGVPINVNNLPDGVKIANRAVISETGVDENGDVTTNTTYEAPFNGYTYREALGYIAQLYGKFATADRTGTIVFRWYEETEYEINPNRYYDDLVTAESVFKVEAITCQVGEQSLKAGTGVENIQFENPVMTQERLDAVYELVKDLEFLPASLSFFGDMRLDLGDIVTVNDKRGNVVKVPVMNVSQDFDGGLLTRTQFYRAIGQDESVKGPTVQRLDRMYTELFLVKEIVGQKASFDYVHAIDADFQNVRADYGEYKELVAGQFAATDVTIGNLSARQANFEQTTTERLSAQDAKIENLESTQITVEYLDAHYLNADTADLRYVTAEKLNATNAEIDALKASQITTDYLEANYATVKDLNATNATVGSLSAKEAAFETATAENFEAQTATINELKAGMITADYLKANYAAIDLANIKDGCITTAMIGEGVVGTAQIADGSITDAKIVGLTANKITAGRLDAAEIEVVNLNAANITVGTINGQQIAPGAIDLSNLADGLSSTITNTAEDVKQALEDAGLAQSTATAAQGAASAASTAAGKAQSAAEAASEAATKAQTAAEGASSAASKAQSTADIASTAASKAQSTADSANTAAGKAQSAADAANTAAGKAQNAAESAQSTANTAQSTADAAKTAASTAQSTADAAKTAASTAQTTADGKNTVFYQAAAPAITGRKVNDVWFDTDDANRMYYFDGKAWTAKQFGGNAIAASSVTASHLVANAVTAGKIAAGAVTSGTIAANAVTAGTIAAGAVSADQLAANAVTAGKIAANAVTTATIAAGAVNADKIATNAVTADKVNAGAITTDKLAANAVTAAKMAAKTITANSGVIADAAITNAMIANLAVTAAKIADATITNAKIANGTIENGKIKDATITNAKIADATIESAKIKALDAAKITTGTLAAARIGAGTIDATKLSVSTLSAITANLGTVTAGTIRSATYTYSSGNYSTSGMEINLTGAGYIRAKNFAIDASGNTYFKGTVDATTLKIKDTIQMYRDEWVTSAGYKTVLSVDNDIALHVGNSGMPTYIEGAGTFDIKEALFGATIHMGYGSNYDFISSTGGAFGIHTAITIDGGVTSNGNMYVTSDSYARRFITPNHSTSWINAIWGNAAVNVYEAGASGGFNAIASIKATSGAWTIGALNADNCFYIGYGTETRYGNGSNGLDHLYKFGTNGAIYVNGTAVSLSNHTHSYLPLSGGTVTGNFYFKGYNGSSRMPVQSETTANARVDYLGAHSNNVFRVCGQFGAAGYTNHNITAPSSDIRLKTNIALTNVEAMPTLMKMRVCQFDWIDGRTDNHQNIGFIADQLEQIDGKLAVGGGYDEDGVINIKSVDTFYMLGYVVKGIQELAVELTAVKRDIGARVTAQESQIEQLRSQLAQAYARIAVLENKVQMRSAG